MKVLAVTSCGVETVQTVDPEELATLAKWLCSDESYHDKVRPALSNEKWESECRVNGGFCNDCRDLAGRIMVFNGSDCQ